MATDDLPEEWYWDLRLQRAVPAGQRGSADHLLGPYPSREAAQHWRDRVERRNDAWDEDDERWEGRGREEPPSRDV